MCLIATDFYMLFLKDIFSRPDCLAASLKQNETFNL